MENLFQKYTKIHNYSEKKYIKNNLHNFNKNDQFIITEKIHGANFQMIDPPFVFFALSYFVPPFVIKKSIFIFIYKFIIFSIINYIYLTFPAKFNVISAL